MATKPEASQPPRRQVIQGSLRSESATIFDRLLNQLSRLVPDTNRDPTPTEYEYHIHPGMAPSPGEVGRAKRFLDYMQILVGEDDLRAFTTVPHRICYRITPTFVSISISGNVAEPAEGEDIRTFVYNFSMTSLNRNAALS
jgi:hypothetical protein